MQLKKRQKYVFRSVLFVRPSFLQKKRNVVSLLMVPIGIKKYRLLRFATGTNELTIVVDYLYIR